MGGPPPPTPPAGASLSDLLTTAKNLVTALNNLTQTYRSVNGITTLEAITVPTVVKTSSGRVAQASVIVAGSTPGTIYDSTQTTVTTAPLCTIPNTVGIFVVNLPADSGIVVVPGNGQSVTVSWS
jgi:hypothetical protein